MSRVSTLQGGRVIVALAALSWNLGAQTPVPPAKAEAPGHTAAQVIDLPTVLRLANAQNLDIKIARERLKEAQANRDSATEEFLPWIAPAAAFRRHEGKTQAVDGTMLDVDKQSYDVGGALIARVEVGEALYKTLAAKQLIKASDQGLEAQRRDSTASAAQAYFELAKTKELVEVSREGLRISQDYQDQIHAAVASGLAFKGDELRVRTQTERSQIGLRQALERQRLAAASLAQVLNLDPSVELVSEASDLVPLPLIEVESALDGLVQQALRSRPELKQSQALVSAAREAKNGTVYGPLVPTIGAQAFGGGLGGGQGSSTGNFGATADYSVGLGWRVGPGGVLDFGRVRASKARLETLRLTDEKLKAQIIGEVVESHTKVQSLFDQITTTKKGLATTDEALRLTRERKEFGVGVVLEDIQAQQELTRARFDYVTAVAEFNQAEYALARAIGSLEAVSGR